MIEIKKVTDPKTLELICKKHSIVLSKEDHVIATIERGEVLQCAVFSYEGECGEIKVISGFDGDLNLLDGLCRAILNIMDINGVKEVYFTEDHAELAKKVGFKESDGVFSLRLEGFFKCGCCSSNQ